eukprot:m.35692 g.35692  ORF g.35692 m.35692 type:complete len:96 (-) comp9913_c0_seq4:3659-3946(-)
MHSAILVCAMPMVEEWPRMKSKQWSGTQRQLSKEMTMHGAHCKVIFVTFSILQTVVDEEAVANSFTPPCHARNGHIVQTVVNVSFVTILSSERHA